MKPKQRDFSVHLALGREVHVSASDVAGRLSP